MASPLLSDWYTHLQLAIDTGIYWHLLCPAKFWQGCLKKWPAKGYARETNSNSRQVYENEESHASGTPGLFVRLLCGKRQTTARPS